MNNKKLWHSITIKVPAELVEFNKNGKVLIKKTLTKQFNISKFQKKTSIKLIPTESNKVEIIDDGTDFKNDHKTDTLNKEKKINVHLDSNKKNKNQRKRITLKFGNLNLCTY